MRWVFRLLSEYKYKKYKKELAKKQVLSISRDKLERLNKKLNKFVDGLSTEELVYLGTLEDGFWLELAFLEAIKYPEVKKLYERAELEALRAYVTGCGTKEDIQREFLVGSGKSMDKVIAAFRGYCSNIVDKGVN